LQNSPKFTQIWIFGKKMCHLATLKPSVVVCSATVAERKLKSQLHLESTLMKKVQELGDQIVEFSPL
jgi:hypothetical protein